MRTTQATFRQAESALTELQTTVTRPGEPVPSAVFTHPTMIYTLPNWVRSGSSLQSLAPSQLHDASMNEISGSVEAGASMQASRAGSVLSSVSMAWADAEVAVEPDSNAGSVGA